MVEVVVRGLDDRAYPHEAMVLARSLQAMAQAGVPDVREALAKKQIEVQCSLTHPADECGSRPA